ncbi:uncharacterized protein BCR38DRAFT_408092 [Pseudomassariella vexata]|uniref:Uncharacterized protein n=1 Tax=Pseudomassariella vexata TaxID=1141098 RepID=A0A1Y2E447_9PEZI|nr:uncharacterized protein BCR38DRAFT_408092 [Pseudomassariella vexata]ORY66124.1 hypothetical protein BCR38DRAFT_408092 [Pseudomassariella vexata]
MPVSASVTGKNESPTTNSSSTIKLVPTNGKFHKVDKLDEPIYRYEGRRRPHSQSTRNRHGRRWTAGARLAVRGGSRRIQMGACWLSNDPSGKPNRQIAPTRRAVVHSWLVWMGRRVQSHDTTIAKTWTWTLCYAPAIAAVHSKRDALAKMSRGCEACGTDHCIDTAHQTRKSDGCALFGPRVTSTAARSLTALPLQRSSA